MLAEQQEAPFLLLKNSSGEGREPPLVAQLSFLSCCSEEMLSPYVNAAFICWPLLSRELQGAANVPA
jgi:hypothetical protein